MRYKILKQYIPGNDQIWVDKLDPNDEEYYFDTIEEAEAKKLELEASDPNRSFKIIEVNS